jgi:ectoine hydroxylase-related dioxygenase (phytanoyl-CoA dioxygenase family)
MSLLVRFYGPQEVQAAAHAFHRDGFVCVRDTLTPEQLAFAQAGAQRVIGAQSAALAPEKMNRGFARHSFGDQIHHPEWAMLVDLATTLPILEAIWDSPDFTCMGAGGDYSLPGAQIQPLHSDIGEFFYDPYGRVTFHDVPAPFIVVNFLMTHFTPENGAIRFVPCTQRSRVPPPRLDEEAPWMKMNQLCAPAGTAVIRDVRCWHGGTANRSDQVRPMTSVGYYAPWRRARTDKVLPRERFDGMSARAQALCGLLVADPEESSPSGMGIVGVSSG